MFTFVVAESVCFANILSNIVIYDINNILTNMFRLNSEHGPPKVLSQS